MAEILHKLMVAEIASKHEINRLEVSSLIKKCPSVISELERCEAAIQEIPEFDVEVFPLMSGAVIESRSLRSEHQPKKLIRNKILAFTSNGSGYITL